MIDDGKVAFIYIDWAWGRVVCLSFAFSHCFFILATFVWVGYLGSVWGKVFFFLHLGFLILGLSLIFVLV